MKKEELSGRQIMVLMTTAALAPCTALLPTMSARASGGAGWLSAIAALPILLAAHGITRGIMRLGPEHLPVAWRKVLSLIGLVGTFLTLTITLRLSGARLAEIYGERAALLCTGILLALAVWMARGKPAAFARAAEIFYLVLSVFTAGVLLLAVWKVEWSSFTATGGELAALPQSGIAAAGLILNVYPAVLLRGRTGGKTGGAAGWTSAFCGVLAALSGVIIGSLGPKLTAKTASPFLTLVQGLGIKGAFQRLEALIVTVWVLSDLVMITLQITAEQKLAADLIAGTGRGWGAVLPAAAAMICAWMVLGDLEILWTACRLVLPAVGLVTGLLCPVLTWCVLCNRQRNDKKQEKSVDI